MRKIIASMLAVAMWASWLPLSIAAEEVMEKDEAQAAAMDESGSGNDISGTSAGNETILDDAYMNVWAGIVFNGHYEYRSYQNSEEEECLEIRLVPDQGYITERFYAEDLPGERYESEDGVLRLKGNAESPTQYWVEARTEEACHMVSVSAPEEIGYTVFINRQKAGDRARAGEMVTVTAIPQEDASYAGMKGYGSIEGETLFETEELFYTFLMPDDDVNVVIYAAEEPYTIDTEAITYGFVSLKVNGKETSYAVSGKTVEVIVTPYEGYEVMGLHAIDEKGNSTFFGEKGEGSFVMPEGNVRLEADFISKECENGSFASAELHRDNEVFYLILSSGLTHWITKDVTAVYTDGEETVFASEGTGMTKVYPAERGCLMTLHFQENLNDVYYTDENGAIRWPKEYEYINNTDAAVLKEGWYVLSGDIAISDRIEIVGNVNLILLCNGLCQDLR